MVRNRETKIELTAYDDLFQTDESRAEAALSKIRDIPLSEIDEFPDHPFKVLMDEDMMNAIRSTIKSLRDWIADILEATKEVIAENEAEKKNASPNLAVLLRDYLNLRKAERSEWSRYGQQKGTTDDLKTISQATVYLQRHELFTLEDLDIALQGVSEKATAIREDMQKAANRMKAITAIQTAVADCEKHKAVHDKYIKIGWKIRKEADVSA